LKKEVAAVAILAAAKRLQKRRLADQLPMPTLCGFLCHFEEKYSRVAYAVYVAGMSDEEFTEKFCAALATFKTIDDVEEFTELNRPTTSKIVRRDEALLDRMRSALSAVRKKLSAKPEPVAEEPVKEVVRNEQPVVATENRARRRATRCSRRCL
jgi:ketosteroid isomerase-like protein